MISCSAGSVITWAQNRAYQVGLPRPARCSVTGRTRQSTQSRTSEEPSAVASARSRSTSMGAACRRATARTRSALVPKW